MQNTKTIILNAEQVAEAIEAKYGDSLEQPQSGIYLKHGITPILVPGKKYHMLVPTELGLRTVPVTDERSIVGPVFDEEGTTVISRHFVEKKLYTFGPTRPVVAAHLVRQAIEATVNRCSRYYKGAQFSMDDVITAHLRKDMFEIPVGPKDREYQRYKLMVEEDIYSTCSEIKEELYELIDAVKSFMQDSPWAMVRIFDVNGLDVGLERGMDFRAYTWHIEHGVPIEPDDQ